MSRRLENVIIEQQSFEVLIPHYDRDDSFFYGDPPYYDSEYVYDAEFGWDHHASLVCTAALLDKMRVSAKMFNRCGLPFSLQKCPFECVTSTENAQNEQGVFALFF